VFDADHPPDPADVADCVHCGFCLPSCPTYVLWGEEMDSPRGRIHLIGQGLEGAPITDTLALHVDRCLGCMACVTACPSGVRYDRLIEATRAQVERQHPRSWRDRLLRWAVFAMFPRPSRLRQVMGLLRIYQRLGGRRLLRRLGLLDRLPASLRTMERLAPTVRPATPVAVHTPAVGERRATVGLLTGCVQRVLFGEVNAATVRVLAAEGFDVIAPEAQGCCGALSLHAGRRTEAVRMARALIDCFEAAGVDTVVVNSAGCGSSMKEYADLLSDDPAYGAKAARFAGGLRDITELLAAVAPRAPRHPLPLTVAYHDACHLAHAQGVRQAPRALLQAIPGLRVREVTEGELCCGSAGIYNLVQPEAGEALGDRKAEHVLATGAALVVAANPGCLLQLGAAFERAGRPMALAHTIEVLDASIRGIGPAALLR